MKSTRKMKILSVLMSAAMVFGTMPASIAMGAENDDIVQNSENTDGVSADDTGITLSAYEGSTEDTTGDPVVEETVPDSGYVEDEGTGSVENAAEEVPAEEVTDENEYGIQMLATTPVTYVDADGNENEVTANVLTSSDTTWNADWYVADSDVTISSRITVSGTVNLILADNCTLEASAGITVAEGNSLTIYGQTAGSGTLDAKANNDYNAAIGGISGSRCGVVTINGGTVTASAGSQGTGIGGGYNGYGGTININGGTVTASAGTYGAGIGSGYNGHGGTINISGGTVTASGGEYGAGIGGGQADSVGGTINISGGTVTAKGTYGTAIGAGSSGTGKQYVTISGGTVTASGNHGAGIGGGSGSSSASFTTEDTGNAFIVVTGYYGISDTSNKEYWSGAIIIKGEGQVYGTPTLTTDAEIPAGDTLLIPENTSLTIDSGTTLTNSGIVYQNWGSTFNKNNSYVDQGKTYYEIINYIDNSSLDGTTENSGQTYGAAGNTIIVSLLDGSSLPGLILIKNDGSSEITGASFAMPDQPIQLEAATIVEIPAADTTTYTYNGSQQTYTLAESNYYTIEGNEQTNAGTYTVTVSLIDPDATVWSDGTTEDQTYTFVINKADQSISYQTTTVSKYDYDEPFTNELTKTRVVGAITYSFTTQSRDEPVIALDENSGKVSILGPGVVTVTATASGNSNYNQATASYILVVNADEISAEIDVNHDSVEYDDDKGEYVDELTYSGADLELEMTLDLTADEQSHLQSHEIAYQWYSYDFETSDFNIIEGANASAYTLSGDAVNAGDYIYLCEAVVTYDNDYTHTVYSVIEITIDKAQQDISYAEGTLSKTIADEDFTNDLTETIISKDDGAKIEYASSDPAVATVDENGEVHILSAGTTTIQATAVETGNYYEDTASYTLEVTDEILSATVNVNDDETKDYNNQTYEKSYDGEDVTLRVTPSSDSESEPIDYTYQWSKDDEEIAGATDAFYTLSGGDVSDNGKYSCLVTAAYPNGNTAKVTVEVTVDITRAEITESMFTLDDSDETYTGSPITKEITSDLVEGTDYTVSYADNTNAGTATITITGMGDYAGDLTYTFTIRPAEFGEGDITASGYSGVYDGKAHSITVALSGAAKDATVTYSTEEDGPYTEKNPEFTNAGTHTVYYKVSKDNYNEVTGSETVVITEQNIKTETMVTVTVTDLVYDATSHNAGIVVTATDGTVLKEGVDYILNGQTAKAAGTHKAVITGIGKYYGTTTVNYKIAKADQKLTAKVKKTGTKKYTIKASKLKNDSRTFKIKVTRKGKMKVRYDTNNSRIKVDKDGKVTLKKGLKAGTYKIKVTTGASKNYKASKNPKYITVKVK